MGAPRPGSPRESEGHTAGKGCVTVIRLSTHHPHLPIASPLNSDWSINSFIRVVLSTLTTDQ